MTSPRPLFFKSKRARLCLCLKGWFILFLGWAIIGATFGYLAGLAVGK